MSMEFIAIISVGVAMLGVGVALASLIITGQNSLRSEMREQGKEIEGVKIELASLRSTVETYFRVRVDPPQQAAVAEPPEDYGAD